MRTIAILILSILSWQTGRAEFSADLADATKPLVDGVPEVAVVRLRGLLSRNLTEREWCTTAEKLTEALLAANQPGDALFLLDDVRLREVVPTKYWRAQALAGLRRPADALLLYEQVAADEHSPFRANAIFGAGEMLRELNRPDGAAQKFLALSRDPVWGVRARLRATELFLDNGDVVNARRTLDTVQPKTEADNQESSLFRGRLSMVQRPDRAIDTFQTILRKPRGATHDVLVAALFGIADAHLQQKTPEAGDDTLEDFIEHHPYDVDLARIFAKLDELYRAERSPSRSELQRWARDVAQPRRAFAQWYLARSELRAGHADGALELFTVLRQGKPKSKEIAAAFLEFAELEIRNGQFSNAIEILNEARSLRPEESLLDRINFIAGQVQYQARQFEAAAATFEQVAHSSSPLARTSLFNASLVWLQLGNHTRFLISDSDLNNSGKENSRAGLRLEEALLQAARGDKNASESLRNFLHDFPNDERASEAWVALAELAFHAMPPRSDEARKDLTRASETKPTTTAAERSDYLMIWIEDSANTNEAKVIERAKEFLARHGNSKLAPEVRLKLAEEYYRRQDFPNAQTEFETLSENNRSGPLTEKALFFAAKSAVSSMAPHALDHALTLFDQVVQLNGEMTWAARNEQAAIERKLGKPADALSLYEEVLKNDPRPDEKREALCGKADIFFEMGGSNPKNYGLAIEIYDELIANADKQVQWRNQALFKKGICLEKDADRAGALATFFKVIDNEIRPDRPNELFWFYKAGFNAARLLEDDSKWQSAVAIYEKLAAASGLRSEEAKARLNRLRLEHFLWQE
jgi:predicted negative regulator of RcsB-dependent stress response